MKLWICSVIPYSFSRTDHIYIVQEYHRYAAVFPKHSWFRESNCEIHLIYVICVKLHIMATKQKVKVRKSKGA